MRPTRITYLLIAAWLTILMPACQHNQPETVSEPEPENEEASATLQSELENILGEYNNPEGFTMVYDFLANNPDLIRNSDSFEQHSHGFNTYLWKDCGPIRIYTVPTIYDGINYYGNTIVQFKDYSGKLDTNSFSDEYGLMLGLRTIESAGKTYYLYWTSHGAMNQGYIESETIRAFSVDGNRIVKEKLFHAGSRQYDMITVSCGGMRYLPLAFGEMQLICLCNFKNKSSDRYPPTVIITEVNQRDWPTGYGLKYVWQDDHFEYVGRCDYDATDLFYDTEFKL